MKSSSKPRNTDLNEEAVNIQVTSCAEPEQEQPIEIPGHRTTTWNGGTLIESWPMIIGIPKHLSDERLNVPKTIGLTVICADTTVRYTFCIKLIDSYLCKLIINKFVNSKPIKCYKRGRLTTIISLDWVVTSDTPICKKLYLSDLWFLMCESEWQFQSIRLCRFAGFWTERCRTRPWTDPTSNR